MVSCPRRMLAACIAPLLGGCLVSEPPDLEDADQTRPFIRLREVTPPPDEIQIIPLPLSGRKVWPFRVPIQSEDREPVKGALHFDLNFEAHDFLAADLIEASTFAAGARTASFDWEVRRAHIGCHWVTAVFAHQSNFDEATQTPAGSPQAQADSERVSWLVNVFAEDDPNVDPTALADCPRAETDTPTE